MGIVRKSVVIRTLKMYGVGVVVHLVYMPTKSQKYSLKEKGLFNIYNQLKELYITNIPKNKKAY